MTGLIPGLHSENINSVDGLDGIFLVRVNRAFYHWNPTRTFYLLRLYVLERKQHHGHSLIGRFYCTPKAPRHLNWRDFGYNSDLLSRDEVDEKALVGLQSSVCVSHTVLNGHSFLNLDGFAPAGDWEFSPGTARGIQP